MQEHKSICLIICIAVLAVFLPCMLQATYIDASGTISANTVWAGVDSVRVTGNIEVNEGVTLTINPGIRVSFQGHYSMSIFGRLLAVGTSSGKIRFTANNHSVGWDRICIQTFSITADSSKVVHAILEYGRTQESSTSGYGGAIEVVNNSKLLISDCLFQNNYAELAGGAVNVTSSGGLKIQNSVFTNNFAEMTGGAIRLSDNGELKNLLIYNNNTGSDGGGGGVISSSSPLFVNCTIVNNGNSGVKLTSDSNAVFRNCIIYGNEEYNVNIYQFNDSPNPDFYYCNVGGGLARLLWLGESNPEGYTGDWQNSIDANPQFVGSGLHPYDLLSTSPCINTGDPITTAGVIGLYDIGGGNRIINGRVDMGAYEELKPADTIPGNCLEFDGVSDNVSGSGISTSLSAFTIETWVYHNSLPGVVQRYITLNPELAVLRYDGSIYGGYRSVHFYVKKANGSGYGIKADSVLVTGAWMHIAGTYDGTNLKLYVNGRLVKSASSGGGLYVPSGTYSFSASGETLDGKLDEMRLWNYARTETQIRENMHLPLTGGEAGLLNYWQFNASSGTTVLDIAGGCNGTMNSMTDADWVSSSIPFGSGVSRSMNESSGTMVFTGVGLTLNYTSYGTASITATKLNCAPNLLPPDAGDYFDSQYWIVERYGTGTFNANMELFPAEDLTTNDQSKHYMIKLFTREGNSDGDWTLITSAYTVSAALNVARFTGLSAFSQFLIARIANQIDTSSGNTLTFDGIDDYVNVGNATSLALSNILTIEAWIKPMDLTGRQGIFSTRSINSAGSFQLEVGTGNGGTNRVAVSGISSWVAQTEDNAITPGVWNHIAYVRSGSGSGTHQIYVNGVQQTLISDSDYSFLANNSDKVLGSGTSGGQFFHGMLDEVRVWEIALSADRVRETMYLPLTGEDYGILSYWQFNESTDLQLMDGISSNNGTLVNMEIFDWMESTVNFGPGMANSQNQTLGFVDFPETGLSMVFENQNTARITATRLDTMPHSTPITDAHFDSQYWVVNAFGTSVMGADMTFHVQEDVSPYAGHPEYFQLYTRGSNSEATWNFTSSAISVDVVANTITFDEVGIDGQFVIAYDEPFNLTAPQNLQIVRNGSSVHLTWDAVPNANTYYVYASDNPEIYWSAIAIRHPATNWDVPIERQAEFYRISASDESIIFEK